MISRSMSWFTGSRPENGSSRITRSGSLITVTTNWSFWCMPRESSSTFLPACSARSTRSSHSGTRCAELAGGHPLERAEVVEHRRDGHLAIEPAFLRHVPDAVARGRGGRRRRTAESLPLSGRMMSMIIRSVVVLPAPLGPEKAVHAPLRHLNAQTVHRAHRPERLAHIVQLYRVHGSHLMIVSGGTCS